MKHRMSRQTRAEDQPFTLRFGRNIDAASQHHAGALVFTGAMATIPAI
ncbi:MAG: hypothetical protein ACKVQU_34805 [Burkholderiales bacterium]